MQTEQQKQALALLRKLGKKDSIPPEAYTGICYNIERVANFTLNEIFPEYEQIAERWKYFSGNLILPVPPSKKECTKEAAAAAYYNATALWTGTYGDMRRMFARYLVREFTKLYPPN